MEKSNMLRVFISSEDLKKLFMKNKSLKIKEGDEAILYLKKRGEKRGDKDGEEKRDD